jgi:hypothetical protein
MNGKRNDNNRIRLQRLIKQHFNLGEIRDLCFSLDVPYEDLGSDETISGKSRDLVMYCERRGLVPELVNTIGQKRPSLKPDLANFPDSPPPSNSNKYPRLSIAIAILTAVIVMALGIVLWRIYTPASSAAFDYQVRVIDENTTQPISSALVILEVGGDVAPLDEYTDSNGLARFFVSSALAEERGRLRVERDGYDSYVKNMDVTPDALPEEVMLYPSP